MRFVARRLGFFLLTLWVALTLNFLLPRMMPGNPALAVLGKFKGGVSPQALAALEAEFGLDTHQSLLSQYVTYLGDVATGKFGVSLTTQPGNSVGRIVLDAIPWTLGWWASPRSWPSCWAPASASSGPGGAAGGWTASCRRSS